jgi:uncharacterized membrane protein YcaP (DUF421 family)
MALFTIFRAVFGYLFLVFLVRIVGRRPGRQLTPFEFVLVFYMGGLTLTGIVGMEVSITNAICQIITIAFCHFGLSWLRYRSQRLALFLDGSPLILLKGGQWRVQTMSRARIKDDDVMDAARDQGIRDLTEIGTAVLESVGSITVTRRRAPDPGQE